MAVQAYVPLPKTPRSPSSGRRDPIARTLRISIIEGCFSQVFLIWTTGAVLTGYMLYLGASPTQLALIASVPFLGQIGNPLAAWLQGIFPRPKILACALGALGRGIWVLPAILPVLPLAEHSKAIFIVWVVGFSALFQASNGVVWTAWMADVIPEEGRGAYIGKRAGIVGVIGTIANLAAGVLLDILPEPLNYQVILSLGVVSALYAVYLYTLQHEPRRPANPISFRRLFVEPFRHQNFRRFMIFIVYWHIAALIGAPFVIPYFIDYLGMSFTAIAMYGVIASVSGLALGPLWGRVADRFGNKALLALSTFGAGSILPLGWILARPGDYWILFGLAFFDSVIYSAMGPATFNLTIATAPKEFRTPFIAMMGVTAGTAAFIGGLISPHLLVIFQQYEGTLFNGFHWNGYHTLFAVSGLMRMTCWWFIRPVEETHAWTTRELLLFPIRRSWRMAGFVWRGMT